MPTVETTFGRRVERVNPDQVTSIPFRFVFELGHELRPANIRDRLGKCVIFDHVLDGQTLHTDRLVFTNQARGELMQEITTAISYSGMDTGNRTTGLGPVLTAFVFLSKSTLCFGQLLFVLVEKLRITYRFTRREDHKVFQS